MTEITDSLLQELESQGKLFDWEPALVNLLAEEYPNLSSDHDLFHSLRVRRLCLHIASTLGGDPESLAAAAYLHDIANDVDRLHHVELGILEAKRILPEVDFPLAKLDRVVVCIEWHEHYNWTGEPNPAEMPVEVIIFQDADRLDALGAIGIGRAFTFGGAQRLPMWIPNQDSTEYYDPGRISPSSILHLRTKIIHLEKTLNTSVAHDVARKRTETVVEFLDLFSREWNGRI